MATIIDALIVTLKLDNTGFKEETRKSTAESERLSASLDNVNESSADLTITIKNQADETKKAKEKTEDFTRSMYNGVKALTAFFGTIMVSSGLAKLITDVNQANDKLNFLSKNLGMNATEVKKWQNMAEMAGGTTDGMTASLSNLSKSLWDLVTIGDASVLPYFNALNVGVVDSTGNIRNLDDILLDVSDSLSKMSRPQAYNIAKNMGFDEGTINTLLQGRDAMERQLIAQKNIVISSQEELEISRKLNEQNALVSQQWEGLKTLIANYLIPYFLKFSERLTAWLDYLNRNRDGAILIFKGIAAVIGLTLIPLALKAAMAFAGMFAPLFTGVGLILALGAAIAGLSNDYEVWKRGGKSMFDWSEWDGSITFILEKLTELETWFKDTTIGKWFIDQNGDIEGWKLALTGVGAYIGGKWAFGIIGALLRIGNVFKGLINMPTMLLAATAYALNDYKKYLDSLDLTPVTNKLTEGLISAGRTYHAVNVLKGDGSTDEKIKATRQAAGDYVPSLGVINTVIDSGLADQIVTDFKNGTLKDSAMGVLQRAQDYKKGNSVQQESFTIGNTRGERNNNPLNMDYVGQRGAMLEEGKGARFAKFATPYEGMKKTVWQLRRYYDGLTTGEKLQTVQDIVKTWSPKGDGDNDPTSYAKRVSEKLRVSPTDKIDLKNNDVMFDLMNAMSQEEIGKPLPYPKSLVMAAINGTGDPYANMANGLKSFNDYISNPLVPNRMPEIKQFLGQSDALRANAQTVTNNKVEATFGDINIQTSSSTVQGNIRDAVEVTNELLFQLVPPMN